MPRPNLPVLGALLITAGPVLAAPAAVEPPAAFAVAGKAPILVAHAEGVQLYECKADADGRLAWTFREPLATLIADGKTIGRHYAGPAWALDDGGVVKARVAASAPGASAADIPLLKLQVTEHKGGGALQAARLILRLGTHGGVFSGACDKAGALHSEAYSADYAFLP